MKKFLLRKVVLGTGKDRRAFTLIEVLIAVLVMAVVIGAAVAVEQANLHGSIVNKHKLQAIGLAQEGVNLIKSRRDTNALNLSTPGTGIFDGIPDPVADSCTDPCHYKIEPDTPPIGDTWKLTKVEAPVLDEKTTLNNVEYTRKVYLLE